MRWSPHEWDSCPLKRHRELAFLLLCSLPWEDTRRSLQREAGSHRTPDLLAP